MTNSKLSIPQIADDELRRRADQIKPMIMHKGVLHFIIEPDLRSQSYLWSPKPIEPAPSTLIAMEPTVRTLHTYGAPVYFKPSIAEILAQTPENFLKNARAFYMHKSPNNADDLNAEFAALNAGFHVAEVTFYRAT